MLTGLNSFFQRDSKQVRDFTTEADTFVKTLDPQFKIEETIMFTEVAPKKIDTTKEKVRFVRNASCTFGVKIVSVQPWWLITCP